MKRKSNRYILWGIMLLALITRVAGLAQFPSGINPDEAYGAYNAWALMTEGIDSRGYVYPVYFVAWGSGMSVLYSYIAIPLFKLLGTSLAVYRLPMAIAAVCGVYAFYVLGREFFDEKAGCFLAFIYVLNPWHITNSRYGLDANFAPNMFLIAVCFLVLAFKGKRGYMIPSAIFLGATLYSYALWWIVVPLFLVLVLIVYHRDIPFCPITLAAVGILAVLAIPLLIFVGVNLGIGEEIVTPFLSIPRLRGFRGGELGAGNVLSGIKTLAESLFEQYDVGNVGAYYYFTAPFMIFGIVYHIISFVREKKKGRVSLEYLMLLWLCSAAVTCLLNETMTQIHCNMIHIPLIFYGGYGVWKAGALLRTSLVQRCCLCAWILSFGFFVHEYLTTQMVYFVQESAEEVLVRAEEMVGEDGVVNIYRYPTIKYSYLLWRDKPSPTHYAQNVVYEDAEAWAEMATYGKYRYVHFPERLEDNTIYIITGDAEDAFYSMGYEVESVNEDYSIVIRHSADGISE